MTRRANGTSNRSDRSRAAVAAALLAFGAVLGGGATEAQVAVFGDVVHTVAGEPIEDGVVLVVEGKIAAVGPAAAVAVPDGSERVRAPVVVPGLIDAHSVVGLAGAQNQPHDQDQLDRSEPLQPELRAIDAYDPGEPLVDWLRSLGVTTLHTGHAPGALISGQTMIVKTKPTTVADATLVPFAMVACTLGEGARNDGKGPPGNRSKAAAMLRGALLAAREYEGRREADAEKRPPRDLRHEALASVLRGEVPLLVTVHRRHDVRTALRIAEEFDVRLVLDGMAEAVAVLDELREAGTPVLLHPTMVRPSGERRNASMETAARLKEAGIPFAIQGGYESYVPKTRYVGFEAGIAAQNGLAPDDALAAITLDAARILGVDDRVGSLEVGKDGDLALFDGDPLETTTRCLGVVLDGVPHLDR
ncbi:MAG: amidohydrolase family protein [Planctomycetota bacterium JB042]